MEQTVKKKRKKKFEWGYFLLLPGIGYIVFFICIVSYLVFMQSIGFHNPIGEDAFTTEHWSMITSRIFRDSLLFSLRIGILSSLISIVICYPLALALQKCPGKKTLLSIIKLPLFVPGLVGSFLIINIIDFHGLLNQFLMWVGMIEEPMRLRNDSAGIGALAIHIWRFVPFQMIIMFSAIEGIRSDIKDAARNLGANAFGVLRHIIIPLTIPSALVAIILVFIRTFNDFAIASTAGPIYPLSLAELMHTQAHRFHDWGGTAVVGVSMIFFAVAFVVIYTVLSKQIEKLM